jgi:hypothetical protein
MAIFSNGSGRSKTVHFGAKGYGDYTKYWKVDPKLARAHRASYIQRHARHEHWDDPTTPGALSRYILWEKPTVEQAVRSFKRRFKLA